MEVWRDIIGLEGIYQISNLGNVRSLDRTITTSNGHTRTVQGKPIRSSMAGDNKTRPYPHVCLRHQGKQIGVFVHQLVAWHFLGEPPADHDIHHKNGITTDNRASNLEYRPRRTHLSQHAKGSANPAAALTEHDVLLARHFLRRGKPARWIAQRLGVSTSAIYHIKHRRTWAHLDQSWEDAFSFLVHDEE
ncbi:MAG: hypothetical protein DCC55_39180 [Chloroflexi bacterium]|nr:MAG: hypothetical protein DCC55_39180 [Chloroflexota bacterium]